MPMDPEFKKKTVEELCLWLEERGYSKKVCNIFEGMTKRCLPYIDSNCLLNIENEVDGEAFLLITSKEME